MENTSRYSVAPPPDPTPTPPLLRRAYDGRCRGLPTGSANRPLPDKHYIVDFTHVERHV